MYSKNKQKQANGLKFQQLFGSQENVDSALDEDLISVLKYDPSGEYLALGDNSGRVIIFKNSKCANGKEYEYMTELQSHSPQFDPLKGMTFQEKIIQIEWLQPQGSYLKLLVTNERSIKCWKIAQKQQKRLIKGAGQDLSLPKVSVKDTTFSFTLQKTLPELHNNKIVSLSKSHNEQYLLSSDINQSYFWSLEKPSNPYKISHLSEESENEISCCKMSSLSDNLFAFGTITGTLQLSDIRCKKYVYVASPHQKMLAFHSEKPTRKEYFNNMLNRISQLCFLDSGRHIVVRDYLNIKVWDICNTKMPLLNIPVQEQLKQNLCTLFEEQCISDRFSVSSCRNSNLVATGSYGNCFHVMDIKQQTNYKYQLNYKKATQYTLMTKKNQPLTKLNTKRKALALDFHPSNYSIAIASVNCFFIYSP